MDLFICCWWKSGGAGGWGRYQADSTDVLGKYLTYFSFQFMDAC